MKGWKTGLLPVFTAETISKIIGWIICSYFDNPLIVWHFGSKKVNATNSQIPASQMAEFPFSWHCWMDCRWRNNIFINVFFLMCFYRTWRGWSRTTYALSWRIAMRSSSSSSKHSSLSSSKAFVISCCVLLVFSFLYLWPSHCFSSIFWNITVYQTFMFHHCPSGIPDINMLHLVRNMLADRQADRNDPWASRFDFMFVLGLKVNITINYP